MSRTLLATTLATTMLVTPALAQTFETDLGTVPLETYVEGLQFPCGIEFLP
jgi:aldose sugar dehydrogenase